MKNIVSIKSPEDVFYVYWTLTDFCNFRCNYCPPMLHEGDYHSGKKPGYPSDDNIRKFLNDLIDNHLKGRKLYVNLGGGEPTLHPMFAEIVERCQPLGAVAVTTNCTRPVDWWKALPILPKKVVISLHHEFIKIKKVNEVALYLVSNNVAVVFNLSADPNNWEAVQDIYNKLDDSLKGKVYPKVLHDIGNKQRKTYTYTDEQRAWMKEIEPKSPIVGLGFRAWPTAHYVDGSEDSLPSIHKLTISGQHKLKGWECDVGQKNINVHFDGNVWSSICRAKNLGKIDNFNTLSESIICDFDACTSAGDYQASKRKI